MGGLARLDWENRRKPSRSSQFPSALRWVKITRRDFEIPTHAAIADHKAQIATLCRAFGVRRLEVFGSAARATDFDPERSDADFLVEFDRESGRDPLRQFFGFADAPKDMLRRRVDLVEQGAIKNRYVLATVNEDRETVYET